MMAHAGGRPKLTGRKLKEKSSHEIYKRLENDTDRYTIADDAVIAFKNAPNLRKHLEEFLGPYLFAKLREDNVNEIVRRAEAAQKITSLQEIMTWKEIKDNLAANALWIV